MGNENQLLKQLRERKAVVELETALKPRAYHPEHEHAITDYMERNHNAHYNKHYRSGERDY